VDFSLVDQLLSEQYFLPVDGIPQLKDASRLKEGKGGEGLQNLDHH
jgi:hypothetical protein